MNNIFINEAFTEGILDYLNKKNYDSFLTIIIKTLIDIYGELDIINPYKTNTESGLGSFNENIMKFGYKEEELSIFKQHVMNFYLTKNEKPNKYFNIIEKQLIDMYFFKIKNIDSDKIDKNKIIENFLFEDSQLNQIYSTNPKEIRRYYNYKNKMLTTNLKYSLIEMDNSISKEAYEMAGFSYNEIINKNENQLLDINNQVFNFFNIDSSKSDKYIRLNQAVAYYKDFLNEKENINIDNGYVEFLLLSGFISISLLIIVIVVGVLVR